MLVDWLVGSVSRSREARLWDLPEFFRRSVRSKKYAGHIFRAESGSVSRATRGRRPGKRKSREERDGLRI
jgi:hypothetical protein